MNLVKSLYSLRLLGGGPHDSIVDVATSNSQFSQLVELVSQAGLVDALNGEGPYTVFAPVDDAFRKLPSAVLERYEDEEWSAHLDALLRYHIVGDVITSGDLKDESQLKTLEGSPVDISLDPVTINDANVIEPFDVLARNGVVHAIDEVLLPPSATDSIGDLASANEGTFSVLLELAEVAGLADVLNEEGPYTVFAPTNEAFEKLSPETIEDLKQDTDALRAVLMYHVVPGIFLSTELEDDPTLDTLQGSALEASAEPMINNIANIVKADLLAANGVVHAVDTVLLPPAASVMTTNTPPSEDETFMTVDTPESNDEETATKSIVDIASGNSGSFSTLVAALQASDLVSTLTKEGPFTVFAPTNLAFGALPGGTLSSLLQDPEALAEVLLYHVVSGKILSDELTEGPLMTLQGSTVEVALGGNVTINNSTVIIPDILALNGVIHVIDQVLIPPQEEQDAGEEEEALMPSVKGMPVDWSAVSDLGSLGSNFTKIIKLLTSTGIASTLEANSQYTVFAPTNEAIMELPQDVVEKYMDEEWNAHLQSLLLYHVVGGETIYSGDLEDGMEVETLEGSNLTVIISGDGPVIMIDDAEVVEPYDVNISNVVVHAIDEVLLPPSAEDSIFDIAEDNSDTFSTLLSLLELAELDDDLDDDGAGPFTVLAPTNEAFAKLPNSTVEALMSNITALTEMLTYHVISGIVLSSELFEGEAGTLQGSTVNITLEPAMFNDAVVVGADILASNGVIHVIDTVLIPSQGDSFPIAEERDGAL